MAFWTAILLCYIGLLQHSCFGQKTVDEYFANLKGYDPRVRPVDPDRPNDPTYVNVTMYIIDIKDIDDTDHTFTVQMYFRQRWVDSRLKYEDTKDRFLRSEDFNKIWRPDLFFIDESHSKLHTGIVPNTYFRWEPNGTMFYSVRLTVVSRCILDLRYYPHDEHTCTLEIESYASDSSELHVLWAGEENSYRAVGITRRISDPGFVVQNLNYTASKETYLFKTYSQLLVNIELKRNVGFFVIKIYVPFIALCLIAWLSLWIHPRRVQFRLPLLLVVIFIMFLLSTDISEFVPHVPYTKAIDIWIAFCICIVFCLFLEYVLLIQLSKESDDDSATADVEQSNADDKEDNLTSNFIPLKTNLQRNVYAVHRRFLKNADHITRYVFLAIFGLFNIIYWSVYAS